MTPQRAKEVGIIVVALLLSLATFALGNLFVTQGRGTTMSVLVVLGVAALLWIALTALALAVIQHPGSSSTLIVGTGAALVAAGLAKLPVLAAAILLMCFLALARRSFFREMNNRVRYRTNEVFLRGLQPLLFGVGVVALGLAWPLFEPKLTGTQLILAPETVGVVVERIVPALPPNLTGFINIQQLTSMVTVMVNQALQSLIVSYRGIFLLIIFLLAISAWRAIMPIIAFLVLPVIALLVRLARQANLVYLSRSQATIERLHL